MSQKIGLLFWVIHLFFVTLNQELIIKTINNEKIRSHQ